MLNYIIHVIAFQLLFLIGYELVLKKETFFTYNRWYLLSTSVIALLLPLIKIEGLLFFIPEETISNLSAIWLPEVFIGEQQHLAENLPAVQISSQPEAFNFWILLCSLGIFGSLILLLRKYQNLSRLFNFRITSEGKEYRIIEVPNSDIACTFYKTIFLGEQLSEAERSQILKHELVHVKQKHSLDLIYFEVLKIVFWFNPLIYIYQNKIATVHEFIADEAVVKDNGKLNYYEQLLNSAFSTRNISFINQFFNHSLIKKRIVMLQRSKSKSIVKLKYLIILPLMLVMLITVAFSGNNLAPQEPSELIGPHQNNPAEINSMEDPADTEIQEKAIPFAVVEEIPVFPACADLETNQARKDCLVKNIEDHITRNFDMSAVGSSMKTGTNRIVAQFKINSSGEVTEVRSRMVTPGPDPEAKKIMEEEANRVITSIPKMIPAKHEGKEVAVMYSLPIVLFKADEEGERQ